MGDDHSFQLGLIIAKLDLASLEIGKAAWPELAFAQAQAHLDAELAFQHRKSLFRSKHALKPRLFSSYRVLRDTNNQLKN